jgi:ubiquinone/menaquinone biosynthesis C-methylase UbiE
MERKDYFSEQAKAYASFRPAYPEELYEFLFSHLENKHTAWDCATGNGQVAQRLARDFASVYATDISAQQLTHAHRSSNITYSVAAAEKTDFGDDQFDLITVAQALHWFDLSRFYDEVNRTAKEGALLAVWGYSLLSVDEAVDPLFEDFYYNRIGPYWDPARKLVENHYADISFPFDAIQCPDFFIKVNWTADQFCGYMSSWSATQKYIRRHGVDPVKDLRDDVGGIWKPGETKLVTFPVFMKLGRIHKS